MKPILIIAMCFAGLFGGSVLTVQAQQLAGPAAYCGLPTIIVQTGSGAMATMYNGQRVILIDPQIMQNQLWLNFVIAHECAHHANGDTLPHGMFIRSMPTGTARQELAADCRAAQVVPAQVARFAIDYFARYQAHHSGGPGYPTGYQRAQAIAQCAGLAM